MNYRYYEIYTKDAPKDHVRQHTMCQSVTHMCLHTDDWSIRVFKQRLWLCVRTHMCKSARGLNWAQSWEKSAVETISSHNNHSPPICLFPDTFSLFLRRITFYMICSINLSIADKNSSLIRALAILAVSSEPFCGVLFSCHPVHTFNGLLMS